MKIRVRCRSKLLQAGHITVFGYAARSMQASFVEYLPIIGAALVAFGCILAALRDGKRKRLVDNLPTSKTTGIFVGLVELKGTAESGDPLTSYLSEEPCVHYAWSIE